MHQCNSRIEKNTLSKYALLTLSLLISANTLAVDCQHDVKYHSSLKAINFLVDVSVGLPANFDSSGTLEISGFKCTSEVTAEQNFKMSMSKQASLPQFDIIYTDPDGVRFNNIMQASVFPWSKSVRVDMQSTVLADLLKNIPEFRHYEEKDKPILLDMASDSSYLKKWAELRSKRTAKNPLLYAYPLPQNEHDLLLLAIDEFNEKYQQLQQSHIDKIAKQPDEVLSELFTKLKAGKLTDDALSGYLVKSREYSDRYVQELLDKQIKEIKKVELLENKPVDGRAFVNVTYNTQSNPTVVEQKFFMKRVQSQWLIFSAYNLRVVPN